MPRKRRSWQRAGAHGAITIATNMAGRGTDIRLADGASALGGLHVIVSEPHEAGRIDRQLAGRCGRQGDPGQIRSHVALNDELIARHAPPFLVLVARFLNLGRGENPSRSDFWIKAIARIAQANAERLHARMRGALLKSDEWLGDAIGFAGEQE